MLWRISKLSYAVIKSSKPHFQPLSAQRIAACRALLSMPIDQEYRKTGTSTNDKTQSNSSLAEMAARYLEQRPNFKLPNSSLPINWSNLRPLDCEIEILATKKSLGQAEKLFLTTTISQWASGLLSEGQSAKHAVGEFLSVFSSLLYLMPLNMQICILFLKVFHHTKRLRATTQKFPSQLRYIFDWLLLQNKITEHVEFFIVFANQHIPHTFYYTREKEIISLIFGDLPQDLLLTRKHNHLLGNILFGLTVHPWMPPALISKLPLIRKHHSSTIRLKAFFASVELLQLNLNDLKTPEYLRTINNFTSELPDIAYPRLARLFYYADFWDETFWLGYLKYMGEGSNWEKQMIYHHFVIDDLLSEGIGGQELKKAGVKLREQLKAKGVEFVGLDIRKHYQGQYGRVIEEKSSLQLQIANSLRLICGAEVLTEVALKYFLVDVLVDKKVVVQINSGLHYREVSGKTCLNLKSQFRERILKRLGYRYHMIRVEDYTNTNFSMLEHIDEIVKQTKQPEKSQ